jgi:hypothetical protein
LPLNDFRNSDSVKHDACDADNEMDAKKDTVSIVVGINDGALEGATLVGVL